MTGPEERECWLFSLSTAGEIEISFRWCAEQPPFDRAEKRLELRARLNALAEVHLPVEAVTGSAGFSLGALLPESSLQAFLDALEWALAQIEEVARVPRPLSCLPASDSSRSRRPPALHLPLPGTSEPAATLSPAGVSAAASAGFRPPPGPA